MSVPSRLPPVCRSSAEANAISQLSPAGTDSRAALFRLEELSFRISGRTLLEPLSLGRMIARSSPDAIMTTPTLRRIYDIDMQIVVHPIKGTPIALP